jgi:hypothetical protein
MVSISKLEGKDRRRERRRATLQDVRRPWHERVVEGKRKRKFINSESEGYFDYDTEDTDT